MIVSSFTVKLLAAIMPNKRRNLAIFTVLLPLLNLQKIAGKPLYHIYNKLFYFNLQNSLITKNCITYLQQTVF